SMPVFISCKAATMKRFWIVQAQRKPPMVNDVVLDLVVVGASGRMGQALIRAIHSIDGVRLSGAIERPQSPTLGKDAGELAGIGFLGVEITDDPLPVFAKAHGVLDFTTPNSSVAYA